MNPLNLGKHIPYYLRRKFKEKYVIIESDDWGMERALNRETLDWMKYKYGEENFSRWSYDALETSEDLDLLFELINSYKSEHENFPVITVNFITHNIDYSESNGLKFRPISEGFDKESEDVRNKYAYGIKQGFMFPQLHGYSHFNLSALEEYYGTEEGQEAYSRKFLPAKATIKSNLSFLQGELSIKNKSSDKIITASEAFRNAFGFYSSSLIPPTFILDKEKVNIISQSKIQMIQSSNRLINSAHKRYRMPYFRKKHGLMWSVRNARLDPCKGYNFYADQCLNSVEKAFKDSNPAVIDFHRVNISGKYAPDYRNTTLKELKKLFDGIYKTWSDVKFIHSQKLNELLWQH